MAIGKEEELRSPPYMCTREEPSATADTMALPLHTVGPPDATGRQQLVLRPFATSNLYNWKMQNPKFSEKPERLIELLDSVIFTHQTIWDNSW